MGKPKAPLLPTDAWSRNAVKSHLMASFQKMTRLRGDLLEATEGRGDLAKVVLQIGDHLATEYRWLAGLGDVPVLLRNSSRARLLRDYGAIVAGTQQALVAALQTDTKAPGAFDRATTDKPDGPARVAFLAFGQTFLGLLTLQVQAREL